MRSLLWLFRKRKSEEPLEVSSVSSDDREPSVPIACPAYEPPEETSEQSEREASQVAFDAVLPSTVFESKKENESKSVNRRHVSFADDFHEVVFPEIRITKPKSKVIQASVANPFQKQLSKTRLSPAEQLRLARAQGHLDVALMEASRLVPDMDDTKANAFRRNAKELLGNLNHKNLNSISSILAKLSIHQAPAQEHLQEIPGKSIQHPSEVNVQLDSAMQLSPSAPRGKNKLQEIKRRGQQAMLSAYRAGHLEVALKMQSGVFPATHSGKVAQFRESVRQTLLDSESDGRLEVLVMALGWTFNDVEPCKTVLRKGRLEAKARPIHFGWIDPKARKLRECWVDTKLRSIHVGRQNMLKRIMDFKLHPVRSIPLQQESMGLRADASEQGAKERARNKPVATIVSRSSSLP